MIGRLVTVAALAGAVLCRSAGAIVVVSQVYGGGGNTGSTYKNDFIELFNADLVQVSLAGWSVQYASATGSTWQSTPLTGTLQPGQYLLVQESGSGGGTTDLPTPDVTGVLMLSSTAGKVALVDGGALLSGTCPNDASIVDFVGYGNTANCFEGSAPVPDLGNLVAAMRSSSCVDTDDNTSDFVLASPLPHNGASTPAACPSIGFAVLQFPATLDGEMPCMPTGTIFGQVYVPGVTDASPAPAPGIRAQLGFGPDGSDPATAGWNWSDAIPNPGFDFNANNDEYEQRFAVPASGPYDYAWRFSYSNQPWIYADYGNGTADGYLPADAGQLTADGDVLFCSRFDPTGL